MGNLRQSASGKARSRRGSYFYVIDAFIASIIVVAALIMMSSRFASQPSPIQSLYTAEDFLSTMESTEAGSYGNPQVRAWVTTGYIDDPRRTLLQQLALFEVKGNLGNSTGNLTAIVANSTPQTVGIEVFVNGRRSHYRAAFNQSVSDTMFTSKRIVLIRSTPTEIYDPVMVEVRTWQ